jgi:hypothetical protein
MLQTLQDVELVEELRDLSGKVREVEDRVGMVKGRTDTLHGHITGVRDRYASLDRTVGTVELRQSDIDVAIGKQAKHFGEIDSLLNKVIRTQYAHGERLRMLGEDLAKVAAVQKEFAAVVDRRLETMTGVQREHGERLDAMDSRFDGIDQRLDSVDGRFDEMGGKLDLVLEHLGITASPSPN